jgi:hypothetical protein
MASYLKTCVGVVLPTLFLAGCFQHTVDAGTGANAVPSNYRQLVAASIASRIDVSVYRDPKISAPVVRNVSELGFGTRPSVCVSAVPVGGGEYPAWIFVFENGKVTDMLSPSRALGCRGLEWSPFPEFSRRT